jgi:hypothetical protein
VTVAVIVAVVAPSAGMLAGEALTVTMAGAIGLGTVKVICTGLLVTVVSVSAVAVTVAKPVFALSRVAIATPLVVVALAVIEPAVVANVTVVPSGTGPSGRVTVAVIFTAIAVKAEVGAVSVIVGAVFGVISPTQGPKPVP